MYILSRNHRRFCDRKCSAWRLQISGHLNVYAKIHRSSYTCADHWTSSAGTNVIQVVCHTSTGVDKGGPGGPAPQWPGKKIVKIEGLSNFTWSVLKSSDISTREGGICIRCPTCSLFNWNSKVLLKNLVRKGVNFEAQNALKLTYEHL